MQLRLRSQVGGWRCELLDCCTKDCCTQIQPRAAAALQEASRSAHLHSPLLSKLWMVITTRVRGMSWAKRAGASQNCAHSRG